MTLGYVPSPWSIWKGIYKLEPGHLMTWQKHRGIQKREYWQPPRNIDPDAQNNMQEWQVLFEKVLEEHLLSDVPIALFLSGGIDSSSVAVGLQRVGSPVHAITASFPGSQQDEASIATAVASHLGISHNITPIHTKNVNELICEVSSAFDEPQGYSALLSMYMISKVAAKDFKVVLAGDGGDELFGGYTWYNNLNGLSTQSSRWTRRLLRLMGRHNAPAGMRERAVTNFVQLSPLHRHAWRLYPRFLPEEAEALLAPMNIQFGDSEMLAPLKKHFEPTLPLKRALQRVDLMTFCSDSILAKVDRASMAHSLEVRVPFLDHRLIEWAFARPDDLKTATENKTVLRDYLRPHVPAKVLSHPKQGFSLRVLDAFDWEAAVDRIQKGTWVRNNYWSRNWKGFIGNGVPYRNGRIWNLLMLTLWADAWFERKAEIHA
jgi:asparagine synthase (glutamine-hydrolysing)